MLGPGYAHSDLGPAGRSDATAEYALWLLNTGFKASQGLLALLWFCRSWPDVAVPHLSALLEDVAVAGVVVAGGAGLAVHVRDVGRSRIELEK